MPLLERIQKDMVEAMKAKDEMRLGTVRMIKTALQKHQVDTMKALDEDSELKVLSSLLKQRREAAEMFRQGGREELATKEEAEAALIHAAMAETGASSPKDMGKVIAAARGKLAGKRIDGKVLSDLVKTRLA
jgi:uncharacterized protein